jgi:hypothetical protein
MCFRPEVYVCMYALYVCTVCLYVCMLYASDLKCIYVCMHCMYVMYVHRMYALYVYLTMCNYDVGLWDFRLVMWRACRVEGFAVPFAIMGFFEGTCNAFRALLFDADITYWNQVRVDSKEVTRRYKQMMETASYCSLEFISNALSYFSIRTQQSRRLWSTPRPWTTM